MSGENIDSENIYRGPNLEPAVRRPSASGYWEVLGLNSRMETAFHETGHGGMAKMMGGTVRFLEIHPRQICVANLPPREFERIQFSLAGWASEHLYHGKGERIPNRYELEQALYAARTGEILDYGDNAQVLEDMLTVRQHESDEQLLERFVEEAGFAIKYLSSRRFGIECVGSLRHSASRNISMGPMLSVSGSLHKRSFRQAK